jgi:hypothetical protein
MGSLVVKYRWNLTGLLDLLLRLHDEKLGGYCGGVSPLPI